MTVLEINVVFYTIHVFPVQIRYIDVRDTIQDVSATT